MRLLRQRWLQILLGGLVLLLLLEEALVSTGDPIYLPSVICLGAFLVPVAFTTYLYDRLPEAGFPLPPVAVCFVGGGAIGMAVARTLEYEVLRALGTVPLLLVGFVEEGAKLLFPLLFFFAGRYRSEAAGIILGVSTGMGFAAFESMGYGFVTVLESSENLARLDEVLLVRGLTSPAGHAAWTGLVTAALWQERLRAGRPVINRRVVGAFLLAVVLHALWDTFISLRGPTLIESLGSDLASGLIALASLALLIVQIRRAERQLGA